MRDRLILRARHKHAPARDDRRRPRIVALRQRSAPRDSPARLRVPRQRQVALIRVAQPRRPAKLRPVRGVRRGGEKQCGGECLGESHPADLGNAAGSVNAMNLFLVPKLRLGMPWVGSSTARGAEPSPARSTASQTGAFPSATWERGEKMLGKAERGITVAHSA